MKRLRCCSLTSFSRARCWLGFSKKRHITSNHGQIVHSNDLSQIVREGFPTDDMNYAFAYGSGIFTQQLVQPPSSLSSQSLSNSNSTAATSKHNSKPMLDFIFATNYSQDFHRKNMVKNSKHYSGISQTFGDHFICYLQDIGPGLYFHPYANVQLDPPSSQTYILKYGVISMEKLKQDLKEWTWLYAAGRLQKPTVSIDLPSSILNGTDEILEYQQKYNLKYALAAALLLMPPPSPHMNSSPSTVYNISDVYEHLVGLSYSGDPRMNAGAEDPQKVQKLVYSLGNMTRLNHLYNTQWLELEQLSLVNRVADGKKIEIDILNSTWRKELWQRLPSLVKSTTASSYDVFTGKQVVYNIKDVSASSEILKVSISKIVGEAAVTQSLKGVVTAGFANSLRYASSKFIKGSSS